MTPLEVLLAVRGLIPTQDRWIKGDLARNVEGRKVSLSHPHACRFSLDGAFFRVQHITHARCSPAYELIKSLIDKEKRIQVAHFNDAEGTTHTLVLDYLDRAIRLLGGTPPSTPLEE